MTANDRILPGVALMIGFCLLAPLIDVCSKLAAEEIPVGEATLARYLVQGALTAPVAIWMRASLRMTARQFWLNLARGVFSVGSTFTFIDAIRVMPIADALAISFVEPFILLLIGHFALKEQVGVRRLAASAVGFVGALLIIQPSFAVFGSVALLPLGTAASFAIYMILTRALARDTHPVAMQVHTAVMGALVCLPILAIGGWAGVPDLTLEWPRGVNWLWLFGIGFFASLSHMAMTYALSFAPSTTLAPLHYFEMISATFFSYLVFSDFPDALTWAGVGVIVASGLYVIHRERLAARRARSELSRDSASASGSGPAPAA